MKKLITISLALSVLGLSFFTLAQAQRTLGEKPVVNTQTTKAVEEVSKVADTGKELPKDAIKGNIYGLTDMFMGGNTPLTKDKALKNLAKGEPILFKADNGKFYFIYNADGSFAMKKLVEHAGKKLIGITGKANSNAGINFIIADAIDSI